LGDSFLKARDSDRLLHLKVASNVCSQNYKKCFLGYGYGESGSVLASPVIAAYQKFLPNLNLKKELGSLSSISTFGLSALLIDRGLFGFFLSFLVISALICKIFKSDSWLWSALCIATLLVFIAQLFSYNFIHLPLLYVFVMKPGILSWLAELEEESLQSRKDILQ
jgi:hypothetical protein